MSSEFQKDLLSKAVAIAKDEIWEDTTLNLETLPLGTSYGRINLFKNAIGADVGIPIIAIKGSHPGSTLGVLAALHGNELNGIKVIFELTRQINPNDLMGILIMVPVGNIPGFMANQRQFTDGTDLNRIFPGKKRGTPAEMYAYRIFHRIIFKFDCLIDLHTASFGRINSHYIRADLSNPAIKELALLLDGQITVHSILPKSSLRSTAIAHAIPAVTVELGNPQIFQESMIERGVNGILNVMSHYHMLEREVRLYGNGVICKTSYWIRTMIGGVLEVVPDLCDMLTKDDKIGALYDLYGRRRRIYTVPEDCVVVGKSINPVAETGSRIIHIGIPGEVEISKDPVPFNVLEYDPEEDEDDMEYFTQNE